MPDGEARIYVILGSHACRTGILMLEHKGVAYRRVEIPAGLHPIGVRLLGFPGSRTAFRRTGERPNSGLAVLDRLGTVPALRMDGQRVQTNRRIARFLDERRPQPPLFPAEAELRGKVEAAEAWGDDAFQMVARRLGFAAIQRGADGLVAGGDDGRLGPLLWRSRRLRLGAGAAIGRRVFAVDAPAERELLGELPAMLDRIDAWIAAGVLGAERLNAADYTIVTSLALLLYRPDLQEEIRPRAAGALTDRVLPEPVSPADAR